MTTETIQIVVTENGSRVVTVNLQGIGGAAEKSAGQVDFLQKALGYLAAALTIDKVKQWTDAWLTASGLIAVATKNTYELVEVQERLFNVAQRTRTDFNAIVELYAKASRASHELGASQEQLINFTEGVGKVLVIQHTSAEQASGSLLQLGQMLSMGKVRAQEFNSVNENLNVMLQAVARHVDGANGSVQGLRNMMKEGTLTNQIFFKAFMDALPELDAAFDKSAHTIGQSLTIVENAIKKYLGTLNESLDASGKFYEWCKKIADKLPEIAAALIAMGAGAAVAFGMYLAPAFLMRVAAALWEIAIAANANPFIALATVLVTVVTYIELMGDKLNAGIDSFTSMADVVDEFGAMIAEAFSSIWSTISTVFEGIFGKTVPEQLNKGYTGFAAWLMKVAAVFDAVGGLVLGLVIATGRILGGIPDAFIHIFSVSYNAVVSGIEKIVNVVVDGINKLRSMIGNPTMLDPLKLERAAVDEDYWKKYGQHVAESIDEGFDMQGGYFQKGLEGVFDRASDRAARRRYEDPAAGADLSVKPPPIAPSGPDKEELKKAENALRSLLNTILPSIGATWDLKKANDVLNEAVKVGLITRDQSNKYMEIAKQHYEDIINPIGKMNRDLDDEERLLGFSNEEREVQTKLLAMENQLRQVGITMSPTERAAMLQRLTDMQALNKATTEQDRLMDESVRKRQAFARTVAAIQTNLAAGQGYSKGDAANAISNMFPADIVDHTKVQMDAMVDSYRNMYAQIEALRAADLISASDAEAMKARVAQKYNQQKLEDFDTAMTNFQGLSQLHSKRAQQIAKAAALAQATIDGIAAIQKALAAPPGWPYNAGMVISVGVMAAANVAKIAGFEEGGYTGNGGTSQVAGVVHGQEFVVHAEGTAKNRAALEAINAGGTIGGGHTTVIVNNNADGTKATTQERDTPNGREIEVIIEKVVARQIKSGGRIADAAESQWGLQRSIGTAR